MKHAFVTFAMALFASLSAFAQVGEVEERVIGGKIGGEVRDYLLQNNRLTDQERSLLMSQQTAGNAAVVIQNGDANLAIIQQVGTGNVTNLNQTGVNNTYESLVEGNNNLFLVNQIGDNNLVEHQVRADNKEFNISQIGNGHVLRKNEIGITPAVPVEVTQQGQGMQVTITNGRVN
ncbi:hypothetical protein I0P70_16960 [Pontibacter sp. FD36]|uniref:hypothetical protein n=1 Tax=Pontibacter sp. FD36 TaxID=2789860 RepID=UPI0018ABFE13|nr:hypothetical protein [Pontibacter sp. FD36]MBF8964940.1 hypothetical protein [Pontibacter sp. FD36]